MEIIGFILCTAVLLYWLACNISGLILVHVAVSFSSVNNWFYILPITSIAINIMLWMLLFQHSPFSIIMK